MCLSSPESKRNRSQSRSRYFHARVAVRVRFIKYLQTPQPWASTHPQATFKWHHNTSISLQRRTSSTKDRQMTLSRSQIFAELCHQYQRKTDTPDTHTSYFSSKPMSYQSHQAETARIEPSGDRRMSDWGLPGWRRAVLAHSSEQFIAGSATRD